MTQTATITVKGSTYTVEANTDETGGAFIYNSREQIAGLAFRSATRPELPAIVIGAPSKWSAAVNRKAASDALAALSL